MYLQVYLHTIHWSECNISDKILITAMHLYFSMIMSQSRPKSNNLAFLAWFEQCCYNAAHRLTIRGSNWFTHHHFAHDSQEIQCSLKVIPIWPKHPVLPQLWLYSSYLTVVCISAMWTQLNDSPQGLVHIHSQTTWMAGWVHIYWRISPRYSQFTSMRVGWAGSMGN